MAREERTAEGWTRYCDCCQKRTLMVRGDEWGDAGWVPFSFDRDEDTDAWCAECHSYMGSYLPVSKTAAQQPDKSKTSVQ